MNSNAIKKRNIILITVFTISSILALGFVGKTISDLKSSEDVLVTQTKELKKSLKNQCMKGISEANFRLDTLELKDSIKVIGQNNEGEPYGFLSQMSGAIQSCPGYELEYFCMGEDCDKSFFTMDLKEVKSGNS